MITRDDRVYLEHILECIASIDVVTVPKSAVEPLQPHEILSVRNLVQV
ncbi:hypothetical protein Lepto7375DRAFT_7651 [Leptolyngbya sp. PCC 7375]|nr:hypothetical protein Lepto7375DRAFT_7651 [Leptolyngbya sp. PCC 7375]